MENDALKTNTTTANTNHVPQTSPTLQPTSNNEITKLANNTMTSQNPLNQPTELLELHATPEPNPFPIFQLFVSIHEPFGYKTRETAQPTPTPANRHTPYSFKATGLGKLMSYVPVISSFMAVYRFYHATSEFCDSLEGDKNHPVNLEMRKRSVFWVVRALMESVPILGNISTLASDILVATKVSINPLDVPNTIFEIHN